jgi:hypothetical protein
MAGGSNQYEENLCTLGVLRAVSSGCLAENKAASPLRLIGKSR